MRDSSLMPFLRHLPNILTCLNLLSGCVGIIFVWDGPATGAAWFVCLACVFDFFDGFAAKALKVNSPIGKELDSLADMVSFGVLPALAMFRMMDAISSSSLLPYFAFSLAVFSALRLAKFNVDERQKDSFIGLPTPANALFITSLVFLRSPWDVVISQDIFLVAITAVFSFLLVAPLELFALKFSTYIWADNKVRFLFLGISAILLGIWQMAVLPFVILFYIAVSLLKLWARF